MCPPGRENGDPKAGDLPIGAASAPASSQVAVVIPHYQVEPGILREAVISAISQEGMDALEIIVIDDGSPAPAGDDLNNLDLPAHVVLKLIEQPNRGPGAARNRALDSLGTDTIYVAFLDSDDRWAPNHLKNAQSMLNAGYDFYFADAWSLEDATSRFGVLGLDVERHLCIDLEKRWYELVGNPRLDFINGTNLCQTSTVAYRYDKFRDQRFIEFSCMGEDLNFWMDLAMHSDAIGFCSDVESVMGPGMHIFRSACWGTPKHIWRIHQYMKWRKWLQRTGSLGETEEQHNQAQISNLRRGFVVTPLHELRRSRAFKSADAVRFILDDPAVLLYLVPGTFDALRSKMRQR
jgi:succinoglycan biosynthesis protein ExoW